MGMVKAVKPGSSFLSSLRAMDEQLASEPEAGAVGPVSLTAMEKDIWLSRYITRLIRQDVPAIGSQKYQTLSALYQQVESEQVITFLDFLLDGRFYYKARV